MKAEKSAENKSKPEKTVENKPKADKAIDNRLKAEKAVEHKTEPMIPSKEKKTADTKKETRRSLMSRSPSPTKKVSKPKMQEKQVETRPPKTLVEKKSPDRYKAMTAIKNKILEKEKQRPESPGPSKIPSPSFKQGLKSQGTSRKPSPTRSQEKGTNTYALAKKAIVDSYTKKITEHMNQRDMIPAKLDNSKVTVNIDGEHEHYNLLFDQGKLTTDLRIRKTMKDMASQDTRTNEHSSASLENLFSFPEKDVSNQPVSLALYNKVCIA